MEDTAVTSRIEEILRDTNKADEPGMETMGDVIQKGNDSTPEIGGMRIIGSAGYTNVYDTLTGIPSKINNNNLKQVLLKKRDNETYVFELKQRVTPKIGIYRCLLHADDPNREHYDLLGLAVCPKGNLASPFQVRRHMMKKHKVEWESIEQERIDAEKKEDREFQRQLMGKAMEKAPLYVSTKDKKAQGGE